MRQAKLSCAQSHLTRSGAGDTLRLVVDEKKLTNKYNTGRKSPYFTAYYFLYSGYSSAPFPAAVTELSQSE